MHLAVHIVCSTQTKIPIIYIDSLDGCMILYMIFDNQMEKIFMIGLFPSCMYLEYLVLLIWITYYILCALYVPKREVYFIYYQLWIAKKPESRLPDQEEASMACTEYQIELEESMAYMHQCCGQKHSNRSWRHTDPSWSMQSCKSKIPLLHILRTDL